MQTRKSGIMALIAGAVILGACENKAPIVNIPPVVNPVTVTVSPNPVPALKVGDKVQLIAVVGNSTNQSVTWTSSNATAATVSAAGLVEAKAPGITTITATSVADATAKAAVSIEVKAADTGGGTTIGQPSITIGSVTQFGTLFPVNPGNVFGTVDVTMNVDIPAGVVASAVRTTIDGTEVCKQSFSSSGSADLGTEGAQAPQVIVCSINTASVKADGTPNFMNGVHTLKAEVIGPTGAVLASATYQPLVFNNIDVINAVLTTTKGPVADANGLSWVGGDVTVTLVPSIYTSTANAVTSLTVRLQASAAASLSDATNDGVAGCSVLVQPAACAVAAEAKTDATASDGFVVTFPAATLYSAAGAGVGGIEDPNVGLTITGLTAAGNNFAGLWGITMNGNAIGGATPLRLDNLAPRVVELDITPATLGCAQIACYVNGDFVFEAETVDFGVDSETLTFAAGTSSSTLTTVENAGQLAETAVANTDILRVTATDALSNARSVYATDQADCTTASSTSVAAANRSGPCAVAPTIVQKFGVDLTIPTLTVGGTADDVATAAGPGVENQFTLTASDAGVGPSGILQFNVTVEMINADGTTCLDATDTATEVDCDDDTPTAVPAAGAPATAIVMLPDGSAYYRVSITAVDYAGNESTQVVQVQLRDFVEPTVGGMATPSSIVGNTTVTFSAPMSDDLDLGDVRPTVLYSGLVLGISQPPQVIGTYGFDVLTTSSSGVFTANNFIRSIETTAANVPSGAITMADGVQADVRDVAGVELEDVCPTVAAGDGAVTQNCIQRQANIAAAVAFGMSNAVEASWGAANRPFGTGTNNQGNFFALTTSATNSAAPAATDVCSDNPEGADAGCATHTKTSVTLYAQAKGPSQTFANPFSRLVFYYTDPATGRSYEICTGTASAVDNTTNNTRTWTYSCTWTPTVPSADPLALAYNVFALGVDTTGRALMSNTRVINIWSD